MESLVIWRLKIGTMASKNNLTKTMKEVGRGDYLVLVSYNTPVAAMHVDGKAFRTDTVWSPATTRYINRWLSDIADVQERSQAFFNQLLGGTK